MGMEGLCMPWRGTRGSQKGGGVRYEQSVGTERLTRLHRHNMFVEGISSKPEQEIRYPLSTMTATPSTRPSKKIETARIFPRPS
jgi:hypothetical protein